MAVEDFTTYTEVDPNNHISLVGTNHVDFSAIRSEDAYLYKDKGENYFDDFTHDVDVRFSNPEDQSLAGFWVLSNDLDDLKGLKDTGKTAIAVQIYRSSTGENRLGLREIYGGANYTDYYLASSDTWYYLTIEKSGTSLTCKIYSDSARTNLLDTLSLTLHGDWSFRYVFAANTANNATGPTVDADIENLDLNEGATTYAKTWQTDILFKKLGITKTIIADAAFKKPDLAKSFLIDSVLRKQGIQTQKQVDILLKKLAILKAFGISVALLQKNIVKSFTVNTCLGALQTYMLSRQIDCLLEKFGITKALTLDVTFKETQQLQRQIDALLKKSFAAQKQVDVLFKKQEVLESFSLDAWFGMVGTATYTKTFGVNVVFRYKAKLPPILGITLNGQLVIPLKREVWIGK